MLFWIAVWILDAKYYNRLLQGAVDAILEIERLSKEGTPLSELSLSTRIEKAVANGKLSGSERARVPVHLFYGTVFCALVVGLAVSIAGLGGIGIIGQSIVRPGITGIVQDSKTGQPIKGAGVRLTSSMNPKIGATTTTSTDGTFMLLPKRRWAIHIDTSEPTPVQFTLTVDGSGYEVFSSDFAHYTFGWLEKTNFREIRLQALAPKTP